MIAEIARHPCRRVLVTGGEPLAQPAAFPFVTRLARRGWEVLVETSGHVPLDAPRPRARWPSWTSRRPARARRTAWTGATSTCLRPQDEVKFVIADRADYEWSRDARARARPGRARAPCSSRPCTACSTPGELGRWILEDGLPVRLQVQLHKYLWPGVGARACDSPLAVVCVSGGMDSCVTAALAAARPRLAFLHADYGQRTEDTERACFHALADHFRRRAPPGGGLPGPGAPSAAAASPTPRSPCARASRRRAASRRPTCPSATRTCWPRPRRGREVLGAARDLRGRGLGGLLGLSRLPARVLPRLRGGDRLGTRPETRIRIVTPVIGMSKADIVRQGQRARRALREDLVLLPGGGRGLRRLRVVPAAAPRASRRRASPTRLPYRARRPDAARRAGIVRNWYVSGAGAPPWRTEAR